METPTQRPKPHPPKAIVSEPLKNNSDTGKNVKPEIPKKPFIPKPHLTTRPFQNNEGLQALQRENNAAKPKRNPRRNTSTKTQEKN